MRSLTYWQSRGNLLTLAALFLLIPLIGRYSLGWGTPQGYLSDLALGSLLVLLLHRRHRLIALPVMLIWGLSVIGTAELVSAVGRMPAPQDLRFLADPTFVANSTEGGGLNHLYLALSVGGGILLCLLLWRRQEKALPAYSYALPAALLAGHIGLQYLAPNDAEMWKQFNLPHQLLSGAVSDGEMAFQEWLDRRNPAPPLDVSGLTQQDLNGSPLLPGRGQAKNVLIIAMEGITGGYVAANRKALNSSYQESMMPKLSAWAERAMTTPDYVVHSHQTIRGMYALLCGDYSKLDNGTPKGVELLSNPTRGLECLPGQLHRNGFSTHFLQGAGLRFMAKDKVMPAMGFDQTLGRNWFKRKPYLEFTWGMDDKAFFEGALDYVDQLRQKEQPWMLTLLTVGTHQPYSSTPEYLMRYPTPRQAAITYLDDAVDAFLEGLERKGVLKDTLVVITSDESHGIDNVRLASAWGLNLMLAPEQKLLPAVKSGVYGHVDLEFSILDYFGFQPPQSIAGRSLFRNYATGREMVSFTNGIQRYHDGKGTFIECDFQQVCRRYKSAGFITEQVTFVERFRGREARQQNVRAEILDQSVVSAQSPREYQFAVDEPIRLKEKINNEYTDNLIGAQYLEFPAHSRTTVRLKIRALEMDPAGARVQIKTRSFEQPVPIQIPNFSLVKVGEPLEASFSFDNPEARKAFSFHLLAEGKGRIEITDFHVQTEPLQAAPKGDLLAKHSDAEEQTDTPEATH